VATSDDIAARRPDKTKAGQERNGMSQLAAVFVSYLEVPEERLQDHFHWNQETYEHFGDRLRVYVVSDVQHNLPDYAECLVFRLTTYP
jgi:hypothetical protein